LWLKAGLLGQSHYAHGHGDQNSLLLWWCAAAGNSNMDWPNGNICLMGEQWQVEKLASHTTNAKATEQRRPICEINTHLRLLHLGQH
jgi:hypothetical protein